MTATATHSKDQDHPSMVVRAGEAAARTGLAAGVDELISLLDGRAIFDELNDLVDLRELVGDAVDYEHLDVVIVERGVL